MGINQEWIVLLNDLDQLQLRLCKRRFDPYSINLLSSNINIHILLTILIIKFVMVLVRRICLNINAILF